MEEEKGKKGLSLKNKIAVNISVFGLMILAIVFVVVVPALQDIKKIRQDIDSQRVDLEQKYRRGQNLKRVGENLRNVRPRVKELDVVFANKDKNLEFVTMLEEVADKRNVSQRINLGSFSKTTQEKYEKVSMQLLVSGDFSDVLGYLVDLETLPNYINIDSVRLTSGLGGLESRKSEIKSPVTMVLTSEVHWKNSNQADVASSSPEIEVDVKQSTTTATKEVMAEDEQ